MHRRTKGLVTTVVTLAVFIVLHGAIQILTFYSREVKTFVCIAGNTQKLNTNRHLQIVSGPLRCLFAIYPLLDCFFTTTVKI